MRPPRIGLLPLLHLLAIFFAGATFALASSHLTLASPADATQLLPRAATSDDPLLPQQAPSCPRLLFHAAQQQQQQPSVMREQQPVLAHGAHPDPTPFSSLPRQAPPPSMSADHCHTAPGPPPHKPEPPPSQMAMPPARSRIRALALGGWPAGKPLLRAMVPASWWVGARGDAGAGAEHARRRDLGAVAASALRMGSPSLHVAAAVSGLLLLGTIMCTL